MGDLKKRKNKFEDIAATLTEQEAETEKAADKVVKAVAGKGRRKQPEERKVLPTYIPIKLYEEFDAITTAYGCSKNSAIVGMIRDYVTQKRDVLDNL